MTSLFSNADLASLAFFVLAWLLYHFAVESEFFGTVTLEFSNTTPLPAKIYANEGVAQFLFLKGDQAPETSYADRKGKYMGQTGVTLPKV